jgi:parallel beta-helix repeat protein
MTWTVDDDGPGLRSIQQAINNANDGDTILVLSGIYNEHIVVDKSLLIVGDSQENTTIDGSDAGTVITIAASNVMIRGFTIQNAPVGIILEDRKEGNTLRENTVKFTANYGIYGDRCGKTVIANNNISFNSRDGIFLYASEPCVLENNFIVSNGKDGMRIRYSSNNTITGNTVSGNDNGVFIYSDEDPLRPSRLAKSNIIGNNHVLNNSCGINIGHFATDLTLAKNEVCDNYIAFNNVGLNISGSNGNVICHNNFVNNSKQLSLYQSFNNTWDKGYYDGGNYWSDHNNADQNWGAHQNETGSDGIIDSPYPILENPGEEDKYPFKHENEWLALPIVNAISPSNKTYRSYNVPLLLNTSKPAQMSYSLDHQANVTIDRNLIITDLPIGLHSIIVYTNDTLGNEASSETLFTITFFADLNLDGTVNIIDVSFVAHCYACNPKSERWNPEADLDNNKVVNILDIAIVAKEYGRKI